MSMLLSGAIQMSDYFPGLEKTWELKDRSSRSFPGDHASVLLIWGPARAATFIDLLCAEDVRG